MNVWRKVQQLHEAMRHIFDNDTSGCRVVCDSVNLE